MAQTQLGLDAMNPDKAAPAFVVKPVDLARPPSRSGSNQRSGSMPRPGSKFSANGPARPGNAERSCRDQFKPRQSNLPGSRAPSAPSTTSVQPPSSQHSNGSYKSAYSGASRDSSTGSLDSARLALQ